MNRHLSAEQITDWVTGDRAMDEERHLRECPACRAEVEQLDQTLALFRESGERWSAHWYGGTRRSAAPRQGWRLAIACALAASLFAGSLLLHRPAPIAAADSPFLQIPYTAPLAPYERASVMRVEVPVAALVAAGFSVHGSDPAGTVTADVLVGQDGRAHAFRLISNRSILQ